MKNTESIIDYVNEELFNKIKFLEMVRLLLFKVKYFFFKQNRQCFFYYFFLFFGIVWMAVFKPNIYSSIICLFFLSIIVLHKLLSKFFDAIFSMFVPYAKENAIYKVFYNIYKIQIEGKVGYERYSQITQHIDNIELFKKQEPSFKEYIKHYLNGLEIEIYRIVCLASKNCFGGQNTKTLVKIPILVDKDKILLIEMNSLENKNNKKDKLRKLKLAGNKFNNTYSIYTSDENWAMNFIKMRLLKCLLTIKECFEEDVNVSIEKGYLNILINTKLNDFAYSDIDSITNLYLICNYDNKEIYDILNKEFNTIFDIINTLEIEKIN